MTNRNVSSSNLERAREASRRIQGEAPGPAAAVAPQTYVRFRAQALIPAAPVPAPAAPAPLPPLDIQSPPGSLAPFSWDKLLTWCRTAARAESAFAMDSHWLVIAHQGSLRPEQVEGVGSCLMIALEQARKMIRGDTPVTVSVELGTLWLTGFAAALSDGALVTLGIMGPQIVDATIRQAVLNELSVCSAE